jgi:hypothetical protein
LFGASGVNTITVENQGKLTLAGITVTHVSGAVGNGVRVEYGGALFMSGGKISGNSIGWNGGGVYNGGTFTMTGGEISNNEYYGVYNVGVTFSMSGGKISNNTYGVYAYYGIFTMDNGKISDNTNNGVLINSYGTFSMSGGEISNNGGGVGNDGTFTMTNGVITGNTARSNNGGGVRNGGTFSMSGGEISNNIITGNVGGGGGVWTSGTFTMTGGEISKNTATNGGGIYVDNGNFNLYSGKITGNTATRNGGGCWVTDAVTNFNRLTVRDGVVFSDNRALAAYNRDPAHDSTYRAYIGDNVQWSEPFTQGYNNFDISYVFGTTITRFTVTVNDGYGASTGAGSYSVSDTVTLNAGTRNGYAFSRWTVNEGGVTLSSTTSTTATFTMPIGNVVVTTSWTATATTGDSGGSGSSGGSSSGSGSIGLGGSGGSSSNNPDNNTPHNGNDGSHGSDDNRQQTTNNEPSIARLAGALGVTLFFMLLIIMAFKKIITDFCRSAKRKVAEIDENRLEPPGFANTPICWSAVSIRKLNIMSKRVFGDRCPQLKSIKTKTANIILTLCISPVIFILVFIFVFGILLNPAVYTAIFNLDFAALGTVFAEGLSTFEMFDGELLFWVFMSPLFGFIIYCLIMLHNTYWGIKSTRVQIRSLVEYYYTHAYDEGIVRELHDKIVRYSGYVSVFSSGDLLDKAALTLLIICHNNNGEYANHSEYTENEGHYRQQEDEWRENEEYENQNVYDGENNPFEILGVSEDAT